MEAKAVPSSDRIEEYFFALARAVGSFAHERFERMAHELRSALMDLPATGAFEQGQRNQWEEYSYYAQNGPPELDFAFDALVDPLADDLARRLSAPEAVLLTMARYWFTDELESGPQLAISADELRFGIIDALRKLACEAILE